MKEDTQNKEISTEKKDETDIEETKAEVSGPEKEEPSMAKKIRNAIVELAIYLAIIVVCVTVVPKYALQRTIVDGKSMMNTFMNGDNLLVEKVSYNFKDPERFDVIVFYPHGKDAGDYYIKRVIGLPGETVQIVGDDIYINGELLEENYGKDPMTNAGIASEPLTLGDDEFFVLGDNREISDDSRYEDVGPVKRENIAGKAILRIYPFSEFGTFE